MLLSIHIVLLLFALVSSKHTLSRTQIANGSDIHQIREKPNNMIEIIEPIPTLREIIYFKIKEKPYINNIEKVHKSNENDNNDRSDNDSDSGSSKSSPENHESISHESKNDSKEITNDSHKSKNDNHESKTDSYKHKTDNNSYNTTKSHFKIKKKKNSDNKAYNDKLKSHTPDADKKKHDKENISKDTNKKLDGQSGESENISKNNYIMVIRERNKQFHEAKEKYQEINEKRDKSMKLLRRKRESNYNVLKNQDVKRTNTYGFHLNNGKGFTWNYLPFNYQENNKNDPSNMINKESKEEYQTDNSPDSSSEDSSSKSDDNSLYSDNDRGYNAELEEEEDQSSDETPITSANRPERKKPSCPATNNFNQCNTEPTYAKQYATKTKESTRPSLQKDKETTPVVPECSIQNLSQEPTKFNHLSEPNKESLNKERKKPSCPANNNFNQYNMEPTYAKQYATKTVESTYLPLQKDEENTPVVPEYQIQNQPQEPTKFNYISEPNKDSLNKERKKPSCPATINFNQYNTKPTYAKQYETKTIESTHLPLQKDEENTPVVPEYQIQNQPQEPTKFNSISEPNKESLNKERKKPPCPATNNFNQYNTEPTYAKQYETKTIESTHLPLQKDEENTPVVSEYQIQNQPQEPTKFNSISEPNKESLNKEREKHSRPANNNFNQYNTEPTYAKKYATKTTESKHLPLQKDEETTSVVPEYSIQNQPQEPTKFNYLSEPNKESLYKEREKHSRPANNNCNQYNTEPTYAKKYVTKTTESKHSPLQKDEETTPVVPEYSIQNQPQEPTKFNYLSEPNKESLNKDKDNSNNNKDNDPAEVVLDKIIKKDEFRKWLKKWTAPYVRVLKEHVAELVNKEVAKQVNKTMNHQNVKEKDKNDTNKNTNTAAPANTTANKTGPADTASNKTAPADTADNKTSLPDNAANKTAPSDTAANKTSPPANEANKTAPAGTADNKTSPPYNAANKTAPADTAANKTAPADTVANKTAPADAAANKTAPADTAANKTAPADTAGNKTAPADTTANKTAPADTAANKTAPADTAGNKTAPADTADNKAPADTAVNKTAPADTAANKTAPADTAANKTAPAGTAANKTAPADTAANKTVPADTTVGKK